MMESEVTAWLLRDGSGLLSSLPAANFWWDDPPETAASPLVVVRRGESDVEYNLRREIDLVRTNLVFECYAAEKLETVEIATAVGAELGLLSGGEIFWTMFQGMPDKGYHQPTGRFRRDVKFEIVHRESSL